MKKALAVAVAVIGFLGLTVAMIFRPRRKSSGEEDAE